jgi:hypothetical protein
VATALNANGNDPDAIAQVALSIHRDDRLWTNTLQLCARLI